ncbi:MAG TPA: hypothetical protein DCP90_05390 [Clostridiales bacterium]|nr:MAG: hypothetical protein A2Y22_08815 [Clostridiales bacterium GWD2_32_59]HAN10034.1 hypothetical protein [Clostridiales bacterium]
MKKIIFFRHGESYKNATDITGGNGAPLTPNGKNQVNDISTRLNTILEDSQEKINIYMSCNRVQVQETANIIKENLGITDQINMSSDYRPWKLGVFDSLSAELRKSRYPEAYEKSRLWLSGNLDVKSARAPGMEDIVTYYDMINGFIEQLPDNEIYIMVGVRSDLEAFINIFNNGSPREEMKYKHYDTTYCEEMVYDERNGNYSLNCDQSSPEMILKIVQVTSDQKVSETIESISSPNPDLDNKNIDDDFCNLLADGCLNASDNTFELVSSEEDEKIL